MKATRIGQRAMSLRNRGLVDSPPDILAAEGRDHPLDLAPVAKAGDIADIAATLGTRRGFKTGIVAIALHELLRVGQRNPSMDEGGFHERTLDPRPFPDCRQMS